MPDQYDITLHSPALGFWKERIISAESPEEALDKFLDELGHYGVTRTGPTTARVLDELTVSVIGRLRGSHPAPLYASAATPEQRAAGWEANLSAWDKGRGASRGSR